MKEDILVNKKYVNIFHISTISHNILVKLISSLSLHVNPIISIKIQDLLDRSSNIKSLPDQSSSHVMIVVS